MRICKPWLLTLSRLEDLITIYNLVYSGETMICSKLWYKTVVKLGLLDDCLFNLRVSDREFVPHVPFPQKLESYEKEKI